jgi:hypothetical protein
MIMVNYADLWPIHSHIASLLDGARLELRDLKACSALLGACTSCLLFTSDLEAAAIEIKDLKHKLDHPSGYTVLSPPCESCVSLKGKLFHATKGNTQLQQEVAYLTARLDKTVLSEKLIEEDLSRVEESATKSTSDWVLVLRRVRIRVGRVAPSSFPAPPTTKRKQQSNPPKLTTHPTQSHASTQREKQGKKPPSRERKLLCACFMAVLVTWMSFASGERELRGDVLSLLETHIVMSSLIFCLVPILMFRPDFTRAAPHTFSHALPQFAHGPNHRSYDFGPRENRFEPRRFGYGPCPHRGDRFLRRPSFPARWFFTHFEPRHFDSPCFPHRGSRPTWPSGEVQRTVKTSSSRMDKCWIPKIYLTNPSTEPSTLSRPV